LAPDLPRVPSGMIPMCYPADFSENNLFIPNWAMWYVLELYDYFLRTGDDRIPQEAKEKVYRLFAYFSQFENNDGLLEDLQGWIFVEWSKANDPTFVSGVNYPSNMIYAEALRCAGRLYGDGELLKKSERLKKQIAMQSFDGSFFADNALRVDGVLVRQSHYSETCQYYAFFCGIAEKECYETLFHTLLTQFGPNRDIAAMYTEVYPSNAFISDYLRLILLVKYGCYREAVDEISAYFWKMAKETGTLWEHDRVCGSLDHGFTSYVAVLLEEIAVGMK